MAQGVWLGDGNSIDYTPGSDMLAGEVVVRVDLIGVLKADTKSGALGSLLTNGVFDFPKTAGGSTAIPAGTILYWDDTNNVVTATAGSNKKIGKCAVAAVDADTTCRVLMIQNL